MGALALLAVFGYGVYYLGTKNKKITQTSDIPSKSTLAPISTVPTITSISDPTANWKSYTNDTYKYSFKYPPILEEKNKERVGGYIPLCSQENLLNCLYLPPGTTADITSNDFAGASFSVGLIDTQSESNCLTYKDNLQLQQYPLPITQKIVNGINSATVQEEGAALGHQNSSSLYRVFKNNKCFELMTEINTDSISANTPEGQAGKIKPFSGINRSNVQSMFDQILSTFKFLDQYQTVILPSTIPNALWDISCGGCDKFLTFLVTDPNGNQTGYIPSTKSYIQNIPNTSYGVAGGIAPPDGSAPAMPNVIEFATLMDGTKYGIYTIQVNGFVNGNYDLQIAIIASANDNRKSFDITGSVTQNSVDTYKINIPSGTYTKVSP